METKNPNDYVLNTFKELNFESHFIVPPHSVGGGGLALFWTSDVVVEINGSSDNFIDASLSYRRKRFSITFTYGAPDISKRQEVWSSIASFGSNRASPWLLTGDFNDITENSEKVGGPPRPEASFSTFRTFLSQHDLWDLKHNGNFLSWRGYRGDHLIQSRLDRTVVNSSWMDLFPASRCEYLKLEGSDHRPVVTYLGGKKKKTSIFRYDRRLKDKKEVLELIKEVWTSYSDRPIESKLSLCRDELIKWVKENKKNSLQVINNAKADLDRELSSTTPNEGRIRELNGILETAYREEESFWRQRSRLTWLALGDKNSSYFHAVTKTRATRNRLTSMVDDQGTPHFEDKSIAKVIKQYYTQLFTGNGFEGSDVIEEALTPCVTDEMNERLLAIPTKEEIYRAVKDTHPDKAPGPDGFSASFYHSNWATVGDEVVSFIQGFFCSDQFSMPLNHTFVRLIPKGINPQQVKDYRPIALCNVLYKFISKLLANRLQPLLGSIVSPTQSAFVAGRAITDNVLITHEVLHYLQRSKAKKFCHMAVKTDMSKAYDRLEWEFILQVFTRLGFHQRWVKWIHLCISSVTYSYIVNEEVHGKVTPSRGIRQGDPLSPYIFILCSEVLSGLCRQGARSGSLKGLKVSRRAPRINHLLFADDTMFFCRADEENCKALKEILSRYERASGQQINADKSSVTFSAKTPAPIRNTCKLALGISKEGGVGKYLGLPENFGRKKRDIFASIVDRIKQKIRSWSTKFLSTAGRLVLLKSVLSALPIYTMTCFKLPISLCKRIQSLLTRFWWDGCSEKKKMSWVAWKKLAKPKACGGLGFRDIQNFNDALLGNVAWRIFRNPKSLLARVLKGKYCVGTSFLECKLPSVASHGWRGVIIGRNVVKRKLLTSIGDGKLTNIWSSPWLPSIPGYKPMGPPSMATSTMTVSDLLTDAGREWDVGKIDQILPHYREEILSLKHSIRGAKDHAFWTPTKNGEYTAKSGYYELAEEQFHAPNFVIEESPNFSWHSTVWNVKCAPKLQLFLWKIFNDAVPTGCTLQRHGLNLSNLCPRCGLEESTTHLLFTCQYAQDVWNSIHWSDIEPVSDTDLATSIAMLLKRKLAPPYGVALGPLAPWIFWYLWKSRNALIFENRVFSPHETCIKAIVDARAWQEAQLLQSTATPGQRKTTVATHQPQNPATCVNTDASWSEQLRTAGIGLVFTNSETGRETCFSHIEKFVNSPIVGEAVAIRAALLKALELQLSVLHIRSDSKACVEAIQHNENLQGLYGIFQDIRSLLPLFDEWSISFISRSSNYIADRVAKSILSDFAVDQALSL